MKNNHQRLASIIFFTSLLAISFAIPSTLSQPKDQIKDQNQAKQQKKDRKLSQNEKQTLQNLRKLVNQNCLKGKVKYNYTNEAFSDFSQGLRNCQDVRRYLLPRPDEEVENTRSVATLTSKYFNLIHSLDYEVDTTFHLDFTYLFYDLVLATQNPGAFEDSDVLSYIIADCALRSHSGTLYMVGPLFLTQLILSPQVEQEVKIMAFERLEETITFRFTGSSGDNTPDAWSETLDLLSKQLNS